MSERPLAATTPPRAKSIVPLRITAATWAVIVGVGFGSLRFFYTRGLTDLYGDALAHMEGARRIVDSLTPGLGQIGGVWLPVFHLLVAPLAADTHLWRTGLAGSLVSMAAYCTAAWFTFRLGLEMNRNLAAGFAALAVFLLCPNMLYVASTPLTEPLTILWAILTVYGLFRYQVSGSTKCLAGAAFAALLGTLTRYDEWYVLPFAALFVFLVQGEAWRARLWNTAKFAFIAGAGPLLWVIYNIYKYGNPLQFYNGPYSARAIYAHQLATTGFRYPTDGSLLISARYYVEDLKIVLGPWSLMLAALGLMFWIIERRERKRRAVALLLLTPLPFYVQAMAKAAVPLYVPTFFPYSYYNLRYGLEMLPVVALLTSFLVSPTFARHARRWLLAGCVVILTTQGVVTLAKGSRELPTVKESLLNTPCKSPADRAIMHFLELHYDGGRILMQSGEWPCVAPTLDIPYRNILCESNRKYWRLLPREPQKIVEWIVRGDGDPVDRLMRAYPDSFRAFDPMGRQTFAQNQGIIFYRRRKE